MLTEQYPSSSEGELNSCERQPQSQYKQEKKNMKKYRIREGSIAQWLLIIVTGFTFWSILALVAIAVYA